MTKLNVDVTPFPAEVDTPIDLNQLPDPNDGSVVVDLNPEPEEGDKPSETPLVDDSYKEKYEALNDQFNTFKADVDKKLQGLSNQPAPIVEPTLSPEINFPSLDLGDMYSEPEKVQERIQKYMEGLIPQIQENSIEAFKQSPEFQAITTSHYQDKYEREIDAARQKHGDRFDFDKNPQPYMDHMKQGKSVEEAHILLDYKRQEIERLDADRKQQVEDDKRRTLGIPEGVPIRANYNKNLRFTLTKDEQWAASKGFPELSQADANKKYAESKKKLLAKGQN